MTMHLGMVRPGSTLYVPFATYAGATGASVTLTGLAVTDIEIYRNGSATQRASDTGYTLLDTDGIDIDGLTGIHGFSIDLSSNADAGFFVAGGFYWVVVSSVTVDSQTVNFVAATFQIGYPDALINTTIATLASQTSFTLTAGPAEDDALNGCMVAIHDIASGVQLGSAQVADYTGSTRTVTLVAGTTFTAAAGDNISIFRPALLPTVAGRTLDVSSTGEAGIDWANIGSPTTAVNLSATNIDVDQVVASVTGNVGGNVTGSVGSVATNGISAASLATDAGAEIAAAVRTELTTELGRIDVATSTRLAAASYAAPLDAAGVRGAVGLVAANLDTQLSTIDGVVDAILVDTTEIGAAGAGLTALPWNAAWDAEVQSEAADALAAYDPPTNTELEARTLLSANYATAANLATVAGYLDTEIASIITTLGTPAGVSVSADLASVQADTNDIQARIPAALVSGRMDASVGAMAADTLTGSALAASAAAEIADAVWDEAIAGHAGAGSTGAALSGATAPSAAAVADAVWDEALSGHLSAGSTGEALNAAGAAGDPWVTTLPGAYGAGSAGYLLGTNLDATVSSRASQATIDTVDGVVDAILVDTGTDIPATLTTIGNLVDDLETRLTAARAGYLDNLSGGAVALQASAAAIEADTQDIQTRLPAALTGGRMDASVGAMAANVMTAAAAAADLTTELQSGLATAAALSAVSGLVDDLEGRLTAARAGYLDNLSAGAVALQSSVDSLEAGVVLTSAGIDAIFDRADGVETGYTLRQALRIIAAAVAGELSGAATTTITIRNITDTKARIVATVDADGNRSALTLDAT